MDASPEHYNEAMNPGIYFLQHVDAWLQKAAYDQDVKAIQAALADRADPDTPNNNGWTPLMRAALGGKFEPLRTRLTPVPVSPQAGARVAPGSWCERFLLARRPCPDRGLLKPRRRP